MYELQGGAFEDRPISIEEASGGYGLVIRRGQDTSSNIYFKGSYRYWIETDTIATGIDFLNGRNTKEDQVICLDFFEGPWMPDFEFFRKKAIEYKVDIRLFTWNLGAWSSIFTWYMNGDVEETTRKYEDFIWECPYPYPEGDVVR